MHRPLATMLLLTLASVTPARGEESIETQIVIPAGTTLRIYSGPVTHADYADTTITVTWNGGDELRLGGLSWRPAERAARLMDEENARKFADVPVVDSLHRAGDTYPMAVYKWSAAQREVLDRAWRLFEARRKSGASTADAAVDARRTLLASGLVASVRIEAVRGRNADAMIRWTGSTYRTGILLGAMCNHPDETPEHATLPPHSVTFTHREAEEHITILQGLIRSVPGGLVELGNGPTQAYDKEHAATPWRDAQ